MRVNKSCNIIAVAENEIGIKESPKNSNKTKYGKWFEFDGTKDGDNFSKEEE